MLQLQRPQQWKSPRGGVKKSLPSAAEYAPGGALHMLAQTQWPSEKARQQTFAACRPPLIWKPTQESVVEG